MWKIIRTYKAEISGSKRSVADVMCDCGKVEMRRLDHVKAGRTKSCKSCASKLTAKSHPLPIHKGKFIGDLSATKYSLYRNGANKRGLDFSVSMKYLWMLFQKQGGICAISGEVIKLNKGRSTASPDRIDSSLGYIPGNLQWVHKDVNNMKMGLSEDRFLELCRKINLNQIK